MSSFSSQISPTTCRASPLATSSTKTPPDLVGSSIQHPTTMSNSHPASGRMDLLTVLAHELGHVLGLEHDPEPGHLMSDTLAPGVRLLPIGTSDEIDKSTTSSPIPTGSDANAGLACRGETNGGVVRMCHDNSVMRFPMQRAVLPRATLKQLPPMEQCLEVCDEEGHILGYFTPIAPRPFECPLSDEELLQRSQEAERYSSEEVLKHWESLR